MKRRLLALLLVATVAAPAFAQTPGLLADGQLANSKGTLYTCAGTTACYITTIRLSNTSATTAYTVNLYIKRASGTSRRIIGATKEIPPSGQLSDDSRHMLSAGDLIEGDASTGSVIDYTIGGATQ